MNIIKNDITKNLIKKITILYESDSLEISMYKKILSFNDKEIILNDVIIEGDNLKITYIDKYLIKVSGKITLVKRGEIL